MDVPRCVICSGMTIFVHMHLNVYKVRSAPPVRCSCRFAVAADIIPDNKNTQGVYKQCDHGAS